MYMIRALALKNANAISKGFLAFHGSKMSASKNCKPHYCKTFLQQCYSTILTLELYCSSILKKIYIFYSTFVCSGNFSLVCLLPHFPSLSLFSVSPSALSSLQTQTPPNININITHHPPLLKLNRFTLTLTILHLLYRFFRPKLFPTSTSTSHTILHC